MGEGSRERLDIGTKRPSHVTVSTPPCRHTRAHRRHAYSNKMQHHALPLLLLAHPCRCCTAVLLRFHLAISVSTSPSSLERSTHDLTVQAHYPSEAAAAVRESTSTYRGKAVARRRHAQQVSR